MAIRLQRTWQVEGVLTDPTSMKLSDATGAYGVKRNDTDAVVVADGTSMTTVSTGVYEYTFAEPAYGLTYTAQIEVVYLGKTLRFEVDLVGNPAPTSLTTLACDYQGLVNEVGFSLFGLRPIASDVISDAVASTNQAADILRCIAKGLQYVYAAHRWSFLRPRVSVVTHPAYSTGTITVDASGNVSGDGTTFPEYSASAGGLLTIPSVGSFAVASYVSGTSLGLAGYAVGAITSPATFSLGFNTYPLPSGVDSLEGRLTYPQGSDCLSEPLERVPESEIRRMLSRIGTPGRPRFYAEATSAFDATSGSARLVAFWPVPDAEYVLTAVGTLRPSMIDAANPYPLGIEVLAPCITESCLAAAEREFDQKDASHPNAVHNRALVPLLAMAIQRDKEYGAPETLGVDHGQESGDDAVGCRRTGSIYWDAGGGYTGFI